MPQTATSARAISMRIFLSFAGAYFVSYALRSVNAALAPLLAADLHLSAGSLGWLTSAFFLAFAAMQIPLGIALDKFGARRTESTLLIVGASGALIVALGHSLLAISAGRLLIGVGVSGCLMAPYAYFRRCFPTDRQSQLALWMLISGTLGALAATQPTLALAQWIGWRGVFVMAAGLLALGSLAIFTLTNDRDRHAAPVPDGAIPVGFIRLIGHPTMLRVIPTTIFYSGGLTALQTLWTGPWLTQVLGLSTMEAGDALLAFNFTLLASYVAMSVFSRRIERLGLPLARQSLIGFVWVVSCLCLIVLWRTRDAWIVWLLLAPGIPAVVLMQTQTATAFPRHLAGRVLTTFNLVTFTGAFAIQWGIGLLVDFFMMHGHPRDTSLIGAFLCLAALQGLSLLWFVLRRPALPSV